MFRNIVFEIEQYYLCQLYILWQDGIQLATVHSVHHFDPDLLHQLELNLVQTFTIPRG